MDRALLGLCWRPEHSAVTIVPCGLPQGAELEKKEVCRMSHVCSSVYYYCAAEDKVHKKMYGHYDGHPRLGSTNLGRGNKKYGNY